MASEEPRERILEAAGPIFAAKGYEAATVREICQAAGMNLASVNYYFGGKEPLYIETIRRAHPVGLSPSARFEIPRDGPPEVKLRKFIHAMLTRLLGMNLASWKHHLLMREIMAPTPACREMLREHLRVVFGQLEEILGEILPADTPDFRRHQIGFSILGQCVFYRSGSKVVPLIVGEEELQSHYGIEQLSEHIGAVSLAALGLAPPLAFGGESRDTSGGEGGANMFAGRFRLPSEPTPKET